MALQKLCLVKEIVNLVSWKVNRGGLLELEKEKTKRATEKDKKYRSPFAQR